MVYVGGTGASFGSSDEAIAHVIAPNAKVGVGLGATDDGAICGRDLKGRLAGQPELHRHRRSVRDAARSPGTPPRHATIQDYLFGSDITGVTTCPASPATLPSGAGCVAATNTAGNVGYCHLTTASSKVHAALLVVNSTGDVTSTLEAAK